MAETFVNKRVAAGGLTTGLTVVYTVPASTKFLNGTLTLCNTSAVTRLVRVVWANTWLLCDDALKAKETLELGIAHVLYAGETMQVQQDVGTDVSFILSGVEVTGTP